jgi:hypothetical protein
MISKKYNILLSFSLFVIFISFLLKYFISDKHPVNALRDIVAPSVYPPYLESALSCTKNSYIRGTGTPALNTIPRGIGTIPNKTACGPLQRDDGSSCWEDVINYGPVYIPSPGNPYVPNDGTIGKGCCNGIGTSDNPNVPCESQARCILKGGGVSTDWINDPCTCRYTSPKCNVNSNYSDGRRDDYINGLCYQLCPAGYHRDGIGCSRDQCPDGSTNVAGICRKGCGCIVTSPTQRQYCSTGFELCGGLCYPVCKAGYTPAGCNLCQNTNTCDPATQDFDAGLCYPKCQTNPPFVGAGSICWSTAVTHPRESRLSLLKVVNVEAKKIFTRDALFQGVSTPIAPC